MPIASLATAAIAFLTGVALALLVRPRASEGQGPDQATQDLYLAARLQESVLRPLLTARLALEWTDHAPPEAGEAVDVALKGTASIVRQLDPHVIIESSHAG